MIALVGRCGLERLAAALRELGETVAVVPPDPTVLRSLAPELVYADLFDATWAVPRVAAAFAERTVRGDGASLSNENLVLDDPLDASSATLAALAPFPLVLRGPRRPPAGAFGLDAGLPPALDAVYAAADALLAGHRVVDVAGLWARHGILADGVRFGAGHGEAEFAPFGLSRRTGQTAEALEAEVVLAWRAARRGEVVKAVVMDLDGVLVHGELADPDFGSLNPAWDAEGGEDEAGWWRAPRAIHQALRVCQARGIALALCTRNDPALVRARFRRRPPAASPWSAAIHDTCVDVSDFVVVEAGFGAKSAACRRIAARLGVRPDSLAFFDDSPVERAEVEANGGGVRVIQGEVAGFPETLLGGQGFLVWERTPEQALRLGSWASRVAAVDAEAGGEAALVAFLCGLHLEVELRLAVAEDLPRVRELVARTTQLRLTGEPLPASLDATRADLWVATCRDRLADHGLVAAAWFAGEGSARRLAELAVSCRVLPHRIAASVLAALCEQEPSARVERRETGRNAASAGLIEASAAGVAAWVSLTSSAGR